MICLADFLYQLYMSGFFSPRRAHKKPKTQRAPKRNVSPGFAPNHGPTNANRERLALLRKTQRNGAAAAVQRNRRRKLKQS